MGTYKGKMCNTSNCCIPCSWYTPNCNFAYIYYLKKKKSQGPLVSVFFPVGLEFSTLDLPTSSTLPVVSFC